MLSNQTITDIKNASLECEECGRKFNASKSHNRRFCGWECYLNYRKGKKHSEETKRKIGSANKGKNNGMYGKIPWNKGKKTGIKHNKQFKKEHTPWNKGKKMTKERRKGYEDYWKKKRTVYIGKKASNWQGGKVSIKNTIKHNSRYLEWRSGVFKRDNYHCQKCGKKDILEIHHIIPLSKILKEFNIKTMEQAIKCKELWDIGNGITLCQNCHMKVDKYRERWGIRQKC
jgi:hypothetical protein